MTRPLTTASQRLALARARAQANPQTDALSEHTFLAQFAEPREWQVGPFAERPELRFDGRPWEDPWGIGWEVASLINSSLLPEGDRLHLFYRASPAKESLASRIGHAVLDADGTWQDDAANPLVWPTVEGEDLGVEDPKIYRAEGRYLLFYNGVFTVTDADRAQYPSPGYEVGDVGCDISVAESDDLRTWTKRGRVVDRDVSRLWAKGAVIPRDLDGNAVRIGGEYLMYLSEGCNGRLHVGRSTDLVSWSFAPCDYLDLTGFGDILHEVATAIVIDDRLVLDFFYESEGTWRAGQALYRLEDPFTARELARGGTLAWGGIVRWRGETMFAQGWDAPPGEAQVQLFVR
ncbi:hypothetical protein [Microbacterium sp.]|uniref:glycoside hydrolase family 130 protein n=1 Tax=Microbacterium sp. TaxID=51671 RepID=UPI0039E54A8C